MQSLTVSILKDLKFKSECCILTITIFEVFEVQGIHIIHK